MGILDKLLNRIDYGSGDYGSDQPYLAPDMRIRDWMESFEAGVESTARLCIDLYAGTMGSLGLYAVDAETLEPIDARMDNSAAYFNRVLRGRTQVGSAFDFKARVVADILIHGQAFIYPVHTLIFRRDGSRFQRLDDMKIVDPSKVRVKVSEDGDVSFAIRGGRELSQDQLLHIKYPNPTSSYRAEGVPPLDARSPLSQIGQLAVAMVSSRLKSGAAPFVGVIDAGAGRADRRETFRQSVDSQRGRYMRLVAPNDAIHSFDVSAQDENMRALQSQTREQIVAQYKVPAQLAGINSGSGPRDIEHLGRHWWRTGMSPIASSIEEALSPLVQYRYKIKFDETDLTRGDLAAAAMATKGLLGPNGVAGTVNEARKRFWRLPPLEGQDEIVPGPSVLVGLNANDGTDSQQ